VYFAPVHQILHQLFRIEIVVFDPAHEIAALVRGANAQRVRRVILPDVFVAGKNLERSDEYLAAAIIALLSVTMPYTVLVVPIRLAPVMGFVLMLSWSTEIGPPTLTLRPQQGIQYADRLVVMLVDEVGEELAGVSAEVESIGVVMRRFRVQLAAVQVAEAE
jgi:hypothetical protein